LSLAQPTTLPCVVVSLASIGVVRPNCAPIASTSACCYPTVSSSPAAAQVRLLVTYHTQSQSRHTPVVTHHMRKGSRLSPSLLFIMVVVWGESLGTTLLKKHYWRQLEITRHRGCHSHRLYSHSSEHRSKLREALFGGLTVDHIDFWGFD